MAKKKNNNKSLAISTLAVVIGMFMVAYASEPLYRVFCRATGYGGTTQVAKANSQKVLDQYITVTFDSQVSPELPWEFGPDQHSVRIKIGETKLISYHAENLSDQPITGRAVYNVIPDGAGLYFDKIQCFCFENQTLQPHQKVHMPVSFFVDPDIVKDNNLKGLETITLSYTFFKVKPKK